MMFRNLFLEFGAKALGFRADELRSTPAWTYIQSEPSEMRQLLFISKVLAFSFSTWKKHTTFIKGFQDFCWHRDANPLECTPTLLNVYLLQSAQNGKSFGFVTAVVDALSFVYRFFLVRDNLVDSTVHTVLKFLKKVCTSVSLRKAPFGSAEIRKLWDTMDKNYPNLSDVPLVELRSFVMLVIQHASFCRFSDIANVKLSDLFFELDYFKIVIRYSKTDQTGEGQTVYVPDSSTGLRSPHRLMCLFLHRVHGEGNDSIYLFPPLK